MRTTLLAFTALLLCGFTAPTRMLGYMPLAVVYDDKGALDTAHGFEIEPTMNECLEKARHIETTLVEKVRARVMCVPIQAAPDAGTAT